MTHSPCGRLSVVLWSVVNDGMVSSPVVRGLVVSLWNYNPIPRPQQDVLFEVPFDDGIVIDYVLSDLYPVATDHPDIVPVGKYA